MFPASIFLWWLLMISTRKSPIGFVAGYSQKVSGSDSFLQIICLVSLRKVVVLVDNLFIRDEYID